MTTGQPMVELPYARIGGGPSTLVVLEGLSLENKAPSLRALWLLRGAYKRYTRDDSVYHVARRPGVPAGYTTRDMADDYARWLQGRRGSGRHRQSDGLRAARSGPGKLLGKRLMREPDDPSEYITAIEADLGHDATDALPGIVAPTLVTGSRDFFFPEPIVRETAERIPHATLRIYDGVGHAVGKTHKRSFESEVLGFLRG